MKSLARPELPSAALRSSQATFAVVDNSALLATHTQFTYTSGNAVQTNGATSILLFGFALNSSIHAGYGDFSGTITYIFVDI